MATRAEEALARAGMIQCEQPHDLGQALRARHAQGLLARGFFFAIDSFREVTHF